MFDERALVAAFLDVARVATLSLTAAGIRVECCPAPHQRPKRLPVGEQAVYAFFLGGTCLKVGKVGPKNNSRFCDQHYGVRVGSTLSKSLLANRSRAIALLPEQAAEIMALSEHNVGSWVRANTGRANIYLSCKAGPFALSLLEAFLQCRFRSVFEGSTA